METPLYISIEGDVDPIAFGAIRAMQDFGGEVLDRGFSPAAWHKKLPSIEEFSRDGEIKIDDYRQALWDFYNVNKDREIFTLNIVNKDLVPDGRFNDVNIVYASSVQYIDLKTGRLISPDKAGVVVSRCTFNPNADKDYNQARAYALAFHEMGHLIIGDKACESEDCVFSHNYDSLDRIVRTLLKIGQLPVCDLDKTRIEEFRKAWGID